jgi:hypothetical protein
MTTRTEERLERGIAVARPLAQAATAEHTAAPPHPAAMISRAMAPGGPALRPADVLSLQRSLGNRAVQRMLAGAPRIQAKLTVNAPGDVYEQEADAVARQVVSSLNGPAPTADAAPAAGVQRALEDEKDKLLTKPLIQRDDLEDDKDKLLTKPSLQREGEGAPAPVDAGVESAIESARGGGQPLDHGTRSQMEGAFGADFSGVRVHTGAHSDSLNRAVQARAFTTGQDIFFGGSEYNPGSSGGKELLAHELTHVVQQNPGTAQLKPEGEA